MPYAIAEDGTRLHFEVHGPEHAPAVLIGYPWNDGMAAVMASMATDTGAQDEMVRCDIAAPVIERRSELEALGWQVVVYDGLDHMQVGVEQVTATVLAFLDGQTW